MPTITSEIKRCQERVRNVSNRLVTGVGDLRVLLRYGETAKQSVPSGWIPLF